MEGQAARSPATVHGLFLRSARLHPGRVALEQPHGAGAQARFTYADVRAMALSAARLLRRRGVGPGRVIATCVDEGHLMVITQLAVLLAGGAFVPVDPNLPSQRIAYMMRDSQASCVVARGADLPRISEALRQDGGDAPVVSIAVDAEDLGAAPVSAPGSAEGEVEGAECEECEDDSGAGRVCWIYYTSGSTGQPKGVLCEHQNAVCYLVSHPFFAGQGSSSSSDAEALNGHDSKRHCRGAVYVDEQAENYQARVLVPSAFTFDPSAGDIFATLAHGGVVCIAPRAAMLGDLGQCMCSMRVTHVCSTPAVWRTVTMEPSQLPWLRVVGLGGEPMPDSMVTRWAGAVKLLALYGTTEATVYQLVRQVVAGDSPKLLGRPLAHMRVQVVDAEASMHDVARACSVSTEQPSALPLGSEGELVEIGAQVARGYASQPALSESKFGLVEGGAGEEAVRFYRTGDLVKVTKEGFVFVGRADTQVKVQGVRCELGEIESVLRESSLVHEVVVCLDPGKTHTEAFLLLPPEIAAAARVLSESQAPDTASSAETSHEVRGALSTIFDTICRRSLPATICPRSFYAVGSFPTTSSGKIDRGKLASRIETHSVLLQSTAPGNNVDADTILPSDDGACVSQQQGLEAKVARVWREALGLPAHVPLGKADSFLLCGGDSLAALSVVKRLVQWSQSGSPCNSAPFEWPADGVVQGALHVRHLVASPSLADYAAHLQANSVSLPLPGDAEEEAHGAATGEEITCAAVVDEDSQHGSALGMPLQRALNVLYLVAQGRVCGGDTAGDVAAAGVLVRALCDCGVPADGLVTKKSPGTSPLHVAAAAGRLEVVTGLLDAQATVNLVNPAHVTALQLAASSSAGVLRTLLEAGAPVRGRDAAKQTLLHHAARAGNMAAIELLLERGALADINTADKWNRQALHWAILNNHPCAVEALLAAGAHAEPAAVPDRVHRRRTSLKTETPAELALRLHGDGRILCALVAAGASTPSVAAAASDVPACAHAPP